MAEAMMIKLEELGVGVWVTVNSKASNLISTYTE